MTLLDFLIFGTCLSPSCFAKALIERITSWKMLPFSNNKTENWLTTRILQRNFAGKEPSATASSFYHKITKTCPDQFTGWRTISTPHWSSTPTYRVPWIARLHGPEPSRHCWWHTTFFFVIIQPSLANSKINFIFQKGKNLKQIANANTYTIFLSVKKKNRVVPGRAGPRRFKENPPCYEWPGSHRTHHFQFLAQIKSPSNTTTERPFISRTRT